MGIMLSNKLKRNFFVASRTSLMLFCVHRLYREHPLLVLLYYDSLCFEHIICSYPLLDFFPTFLFAFLCPCQRRSFPHLYTSKHTVQHTHRHIYIYEQLSLLLGLMEEILMAQQISNLCLSWSLLGAHAVFSAENCQ